MAVYKVVIAPEEQLDAWPRFTELRITAIGHPAKQEDEEPVRTFRQILNGDWVVAHLPGRRVPTDLVRQCGGDTYVVVGAGEVTEGYRVERDARTLMAQGWQGPLRRRLAVDWRPVSTQRMGDLLRGYARHAVVRLPADVGAAVLRRLGVG